MRFLSCFSGIEAASVAWTPLGWTCVGVAEVEPFPCAVLAHHYSHVPNLGDVTADDFLQRASALRPDVLVGGPPCQDFSIAGMREGLAGDRGNLSLRWVEIIRAIRPAFAVTENVPGWLSVNGGHAFGAFLAGLVGHDTALIPPRNCGGRWTNAGMVAGKLGRVAWRVLDARFFGLAQRRNRVFVVFCPRDGADPAAILFERKGVRGNPQTCRETGKGTSAGAVCGALPSGGTPNGHGTADVNSQAVAAGHVIATGLAVRRLPGDERSDVVPDVRMVRPRAYGCGVVANPLGAKRDGGWRGDLDNDTYAVVPLQEISKRTGVSTDDPRAGIGIGHAGDPMFTLQAWAQHGVAVALRGREGGGVAELGGDCAHAIRASQGGGDKPHVLDFDARQSDVIQYGDRSGKLDTDGHTVGVLSFDLAQITSATNWTTVKPGQPTSTLNGSGDMHVAWSIMPQNSSRDYKARQVDVAQSVMAAGPGGGNQGGDYIQNAAAVRRLTPVECARLQGFPDDWLDITFRGRLAADSNKYKALGNSMAVPVVRWLGARIAAQEAATTTKQEAAA